MRSSRTSSTSCLGSPNSQRHQERSAFAPPASVRRAGPPGARDPEDPMSSVLQLTRREDGQDLLEYGILASLIAILCLAGLRLVATQITAVFWGGIATKF